MINIITIGNKNTFHAVTMSVRDLIIGLGKEYKLFFYDNDFKQKDIKYSDINIFIHGHKVNPNKNCTNILIQTEQLKNFDYQPWTRVLEGFKELIDKNLDNIFYFPYGYSKHFDSNFKSEEIIDFYFFGGINPRRQRILDRYKISYNRNNKKNIYGIDRDKLIAKSKFNLGVNAKDDYLFPVLRGLLVMCKGKFYLQESCSGGYGVYEKYVVNFTEDNFLGVVEEWQNYKKRNDYAMYIKEELIEKNKFEDNLFKLIGDIL